MEKNERKEFLYYYESRQNPNGDPGFENQPRLMPDGRILVTDVRVKRTMRDYAKNKLGKTIFVDISEKGEPIMAYKRAKEIVGELNRKNLIKLLTKTFDVPLFGALVPIQKEGEADEEANGYSFKVTGPVQLSLGRSINQPEIVNPTISSRFVGKEKKGGKHEHGTFGRFYSVDYALIKFQGAINPNNISEYWDEDRVWESFRQTEEMLFDCLWNGTNELVSRSKYPQRSVFYLEVTYDGVCYNDLGLLVDEKEEMKGKTITLDPSAFDFSRLLEALKKRKSKVRRVRLAACEELSEAAEKFADKVKGIGIKTELIEC